MPSGVYARPTAAERFRSKLDVSGGASACWPFRGSRLQPPSLPYGIICVEQRTRRAHRVAWELANGPIPAGQSVCHRCDNPPCCNPAHLFLGTEAENVADREAKGRGVRKRGVSNADTARLTPSQVGEIRSACAVGERQRDVAARFGIHQTTVSNIVTRKRWNERRD